MMKNNTTRRYLGPKETEVVSRLSFEKVIFITKEQFDEFFGFDPNLRSQIIFRLKKKGILTAIKRGVYFYSPLESGPAGSNVNEFLIPPLLFPKNNYYIGYSTMYNYYGFTDQIFQVMYILNTSLQREKIIANIQFKIVKILPSRMYGLEKIKIKDTEVIVSDKERTLVDLIYFPDPIGGLGNAFKIFKEQVKSGKVDIKRLVKYTSIFSNISTRKRIGTILDECSLSDKELEPLLKTVKRTSLITLFDSKSRRGKINKKWLIIENVT